jgi:hypothetical protein
LLSDSFYCTVGIESLISGFKRTQESAYVVPKSARCYRVVFPARRLDAGYHRNRGCGIADWLRSGLRLHALQGEGRVIPPHGVLTVLQALMDSAHGKNRLSEAPPFLFLIKHSVCQYAPGGFPVYNPQA